MKAPLSYMPALPAAAGLAAGIALCHAGLAVWTVAGGVALFLILYFTRRHYASFFFLLAAVGALTAEAHRTPPPAIAAYSDPADPYLGRHTMRGVVQAVDAGGDASRCLTEVTAVDSAECAAFLCMLTIDDVTVEFNPGDTIAGTAELYKVVPPGVPDTPDNTRLLRMQGVYTRGYARDGQIVAVGRAGGVRAWINGIRASMADGIASAPVDGRTASFLTAVILGDDRFITPDTSDSYRATGVSHMLALSGMHVGVLAMLIALALFPLQAGRLGFYLRPAVTLALVWLYVAVVGATPSVTRAAVMMSAVLAARLLQRRHSAWNSLCLSVTVLLAVRPWWLFTPGFQMSVCAVASLMAAGSLVPGRLRRRPWLYRAVMAVTVPVAAMLGSGLVAACHYGTLPLLFLPANIVAGVLFPVILVCGVLLMLGAMCGLQLTWLGFVADTAYGWMDTALGTLSGTGAVWHVELPAAAVLPYAGALCSLVWALRSRARKAWLSLAAMAAATAAVVMARPETAQAPELYITGRGGNTEALLSTGTAVYLYNWQGKGRAPERADSATAYIEDCNNLYGRFARRRGAESLSARPLTLSAPDVYADSLYIVVGGAVTAIAGELERRGIRGAVHARYCLITDDCRLPAREAARLGRADTLLLGADLHPSRRGRLIRECGDSIPWIDLRRRTVVLK